jgi:regulatory protein YycI of two-component signal transduction system YycFG
LLALLVQLTLANRFFSRVKLSNTKHEKNITDANLQQQLRCANTQIDIDLQKISEKGEKQILH